MNISVSLPNDVAFQTIEAEANFCKMLPPGKQYVICSMISSYGDYNSTNVSFFSLVLALSLLISPIFRDHTGQFYKL